MIIDADTFTVEYFSKLVDATVGTNKANLIIFFFIYCTGVDDFIGSDDC